ncbi:MAG: SIMPL domain-containing protein [Bacteroidetes bacterium]|nr:SIMPL domain-containing protein [Bacteroidota bacterium]
MKNILIILTILISSSIFAQTGEKNFIDQNYIEVTGKAEIEIIPDQIYLKIFLNEKEFKNKQSIVEIEKLMIDKLTGLGIDTEKDLAIKDLASNFQFYWLGKSDIFVTKEYQLLVHDAPTAGKVFIELEKIGISNITIDKLDHSKIRVYRKEVKVDAIKAAKEKASELAIAIDQSIGRALFIEEIERNNNYLSNTLSGKAAGVTIRGSRSFESSELINLDVEFEKIKIEYSILCRFELK